MGFITDLKKAGKWDMSRVRKQRNGTYTDVNGKVIFSNGKMDSRAKLYLRGKYGRDYANRAEANMRSGNIYDSRNKRADGKVVGWRIDNGRGRDSSWNKEIANKAMKDKVADNRVRKDSSGRYMFNDKGTGLWTYFNQDAKDAAVARNNAKGNANILRRNLQGSLERVFNNYIGGLKNAGKSALEGVAHTVVNPFRMGWDVITGNYDSSKAGRYLTEPMGDFARAGLNLMGAQAAPLGETLNLLGVADTVGKYGKVFDANQWLGTIAGGGTPWADENKGLETAANRWGWGNETKKAVGNVTDTANLAAMLLGTKGASGAATGITRAIGTGTRALGRGARSLGSRITSASRNMAQRVRGQFNRGKSTLPVTEAVRPKTIRFDLPMTTRELMARSGTGEHAPVLVMPTTYIRTSTPRIVQPTPLTPAEAKAWTNTMRSSGTGAHAPVEVMSPTKVRSGFFEPETRLVWSDVDAYGNMIMRNVPKTPKAVIEAAKAAKRVKAAKAAKEAKAAKAADSDVTIVRDAAGRPLKADPVRPTLPVVESDPAALQLEVQQFAHEVDPYYAGEIPEYVDPAAFLEPFLPFSDSGEFFIPGFFKKGGKMLQKFQTGNKFQYSKRGPLFMGRGIQKGWKGTAGDISGIDENTKNLLKGTGEFSDADFKDARSLLTAINNFWNNPNRSNYTSMNYTNNLKVTPSRIAVDNKWGALSQYALDNVLGVIAASTPTGFDPIKNLPYNISRRTYALPDSMVQVPTITPVKINPNYNRSQVRQIMRQQGLNPYAYSGALRKALRMYLNGQEGYNKDLLLGIIPNKILYALNTVPTSLPNTVTITNALNAIKDPGTIIATSQSNPSNTASDKLDYGTYDPNAITLNKVTVQALNKKPNFLSNLALRVNDPGTITPRAKRGMKLPSRNVVERFKESKSFRLG